MSKKRKTHYVLASWFTTNITQQALTSVYTYLREKKNKKTGIQMQYRFIHIYPS